MTGTASGRPYRWGIMGTGRIAGVFVHALKVLPRADIYAAGSRRQESADLFCRAHQIRQAYGSYEELVRDPAIDIVYVAVPVRFHYDCVRLALLAGKHVLVEKAITVTADQARSLHRLAQDKGLFLMEAMWTKCQPVFRRIMDWTSQGLLGHIQGVDARFYTRALTGHRLFCHDIAGGALLDLGIYPIMYATALLGRRPLSIHCTGVIDDHRVDVMDSIVLNYPDQSFANLTCGLGPEKMVSLYIHGSRGRIRLEDEFFFQATRASLYDYDGRLIDSCSEPMLENGYEYEALEAIRCLDLGLTDSPLVPMEDSLAVMDILDECRRQIGLDYDFLS